MADPETFYDQIRSLHRNTYDQLASAYVQRTELLSTKELFLLGPLAGYLRHAFKGETCRVLDVGCAVGASTKLLQQIGFDAVGIDISPRMIEAARGQALTATFIEGDFLEWDFGELRFQGICAKAVLHLFDPRAADQFMRKASELLVQRGLLYISVGCNRGEAPQIRPKSDYPGRPERYRRSWKLEELLQAAIKVGLTPMALP
jgi:SAM-dependent methyltransferase